MLLLCVPNFDNIWIFSFYQDIIIIFALPQFLVTPSPKRSDLSTHYGVYVFPSITACQLVGCEQLVAPQNLVQFLKVPKFHEIPKIPKPKCVWRPSEQLWFFDPPPLLPPPTWFSAILAWYIFRTPLPLPRNLPLSSYISLFISILFHLIISLQHFVLIDLFIYLPKAKLQLIKSYNQMERDTMLVSIRV